MISKFRAWDKINNQWCKQNIYIHTSGLIYSDNDFYELDDTDQKSLIMGIEISFYIGEKDKNNKEIAQGDIVLKSDGKTKAVVHYDESKSRFCLIPEWLGEAEDGIFPYSLEVIGNIYENPELINN